MADYSFSYTYGGVTKTVTPTQVVIDPINEIGHYVVELEDEFGAVETYYVDCTSAQFNSHFDLDAQKSCIQDCVSDALDNKLSALA